MQNATAATPDEYIDALPDDRRDTVGAVTDVLRRHQPDGYREGMAYRMIGWSSGATRNRP